MPSLLQTDERIYRTCIYYEAMCKTPVEKAYRRMKKVLFKSPIFESCSMVLENDEDREYTEENFFKVDMFGEPTDHVRHHYPIANSNDYFECTYEEDKSFGERYPSVTFKIRRVHV
ncbi:hypothetical protein CAEBREN_03532 [Caenorhabditis brenneri]|uniref:DUF38 domain-containing protein n=1 Tax=Caenorhabditis brenneri TaxID=135651 RepID=G0P3F9_CAEBE|nr:hypothetical protein CAEBREN_03532 [Caenorhabditis brenneri]